MQSDLTFVGMLSGNDQEQSPKLYEIYHENTKLHPLNQPRSEPSTINPNVELNQFALKVDIAEIESTVATGCKKYHTAEQQPLSQDSNLLNNINLKDVLLRRLSVREFDPRPVEWEKLSVICQYIYGWNHQRDIKQENGEISFRFIPSAGRLYPLEVYLVTLSNNDSKLGELWHYQTNKHCLERLDRPSYREIEKVLVQLPNPLPPVLMFITGVLPRLTWKYGDRAYRYALLEAGHLGQNLQLVATALDLASCPIVSFYDDEVHDLLDIDGVSEVALYTFFLGYPSLTV